MTPSELHSMAGAVYGARWQSQLARDMAIALRTVQRWARSGITKSATAEGVRQFLEQRRIARIAAPPDDTTAADDRDDACRAAVQPAVTALIAAAREVGWTDAETVTALLAAVIDEIRTGGGDAAARDMLRQAIEIVWGDD